jgi:hypothetical protein
MCEHGVRLQRQRRTRVMKLLGVKEYYICSNCGYELLIGSENKFIKRLTYALYPNQIVGFNKSDPTHI